MKRYILIIFSFILLISCEKVIDLKLQTGEEVDVVEACIYDTIAFVSLTKTSKQFYIREKPNVIKDASVEIEVDGNRYSLVYTENVGIDELLLGEENPLRSGYYLNNIPKGYVYKLKITTIEGNIYTSEQKSFINPIIDDVKLIKENSLGFNSGFSYYLELLVRNTPIDFQALKVFKKYLRESENNKFPYVSYSFNNFGEDLPPFRVSLSSMIKSSNYNDSVAVICSYTTSEVKKYGDVVISLEGGAPNSIRIPENPPSNIKIEIGEKVLGYFAVYNLSEKKVLASEI